MKDDLDIGRTPQSINASSLTVGSVNMPDPIIAHEPQVVNANFNVGGITINAQSSDPGAVRSAVNAALAEQAQRHAQAVRSAMSD